METAKAVCEIGLTDVSCHLLAHFHTFDLTQPF